MIFKIRPSARFRPSPRRRRGQTKLESALALAMLALAILGAWKLYGPQIRETTQFTLDHFTGSKPEPPAAENANPQ